MAPSITFTVVFQNWFRILPSVKRELRNMRLGSPLCQSHALIPPRPIQHAQDRQSL